MNTRASTPVDDLHDDAPWPALAEAPATTPTARTRFRQVLAELAEKARAKLPESSTRIDKAVGIVLAGDVEGQNDDGSWRVGSCTDPLVTHRVQGTHCSCDDSQYGRAPRGVCKHVLACMLTIRVQETLESEAPITGNVSVMPEPKTCDAHVLPEAPASVNFRAMVGGFETQITLRDHDETRLLARLEALLTSGTVQPLPTRGQPAPPPQPKLTPQQHNAAAMPRPVTGFCPVHSAPMKLNQKDGRSWHSHWCEDEGRWCKGR
jgi:hypothetical protein